MPYDIGAGGRGAKTIANAEVFTISQSSIDSTCRNDRDGLSNMRVWRQVRSTMRSCIDSHEGGLLSSTILRTLGKLCAPPGTWVVASNDLGSVLERCPFESKSISYGCQITSSIRCNLPSTHQLVRSSIEAQHFLHEQDSNKIKSFRL